ncbi:MAG: helix-turn-helix domain-containing protein [Chloroflexaceae bacterium]|nr:helix-turn-helix domain-containing protein [Chloroflexaceae bacterium]
MEKSPQPVYLSLSAASRLLGVHSATLRRWADSGVVPVYITPGGHRRFARSDIEALVAQTAPLPGQSQTLVRTWAQRALEQARTELERRESPPVWLINLGQDERDIWRRVSQQLMGVVLRYVSYQGDDEPLLNQARAIGRDYAANARRMGMPLAVALEAALFFRDSLVEAAMNLPDTSPPSSTTSNTRLLRRISQVLNVVQIAVAAGYEDSLVVERQT